MIFSILNSKTNQTKAKLNQITNVIYGFTFSFFMKLEKVQKLIKSNRNKNVNRAAIHNHIEY